jgi:hypothetical protein
VEKTTMNAPVGPLICTRLPPRSEIREPATTAVNRPIAGDGFRDRVDAERDGDRQGDDADGHAGNQIARESPALVTFTKTDNRSGQEAWHGEIAEVALRRRTKLNIEPVGNARHAMAAHLGGCAILHVRSAVNNRAGMQGRGHCAVQMIAQTSRCD